MPDHTEAGDAAVGAVAGKRAQVGAVAGKRAPAGQSIPGGQPGQSGRIDAWLWAVRLIKTRAAAAAACRGGHVSVAGAKAKPATTIRPGMTVELTGLERHRIVVVTRIISKRVGAQVAVECYEDHSPPPPPRDKSIPVAARDSGSGRPTKRERRQLDRLRGRESR